MASCRLIPIIKHLNAENFVSCNFDSDNKEYVVCFKCFPIKLPAGYFISDGHIYNDSDDDAKICRFEFMV